MLVTARGVELEVEDHGSAAAEPLLLIMGLGMQLTAWPLEFVDALVARGFRVLRFDNRDSGLSHSFDHLGAPNLAMEAWKAALRLPLRPAYSLADMSDDCAGLLDVMGLASAHVCGASMGGMIAQHLAARHPGRVKSLTLIMSHSGSPRLPGPSLKVRQAMLRRPPPAHAIDRVVARQVALYKLIGSPAYPVADAQLNDMLSLSVARSYRPQGTARQLVAIAADGDRSGMLARIEQPTQVIHGRDDALVPVAAGHDLAKKIPGAALDVVDGMGHDLPAALLPRFADGIAGVASKV